MQDTAKYLVHADITADGVVERSDVVGAVFGQTEGLLGDELDLRDLQDSSKVGRIDVDVDSQNGQSYGRITIATSLDQVETAILGAALETIDRVGPCRSTIEVRRIEDVRAAKRREVVERAKTLLGEAFDESMRSSRDLVEEVREAVRVEDITEYRDLPAGPRVSDSDAIVVVEGRADVQTLLRYGIKNGIAVEGTNVPDVVAELSDSRTVTAFLDGDRGGELILKELAQVGTVDYVAFAPEGRSVEDLDRTEVMAALREKVPYDRVRDAEQPSAVASADVASTGSTRPSASPSSEADDTTDAATDAASGVGTAVAESSSTDGAAVDAGTDSAETDGTTVPGDASETDGASGTDGVSASSDVAGGSEHGGDASTSDGVDEDHPGGADGSSASESADSAGTEDGSEALDGTAGQEPMEPETLRGHVREVVGEGTGTVRLLDAEFRTLDRGSVDEAFDLIADTAGGVATVVLDGELNQRLLDVAAQGGVEQIVAASTGEFVKQPTSVRIRTAEQLLAPNEA